MMKNLLIASLLVGNAWMMSNAFAADTPVPPSATTETKIADIKGSDAQCLKCHADDAPVGKLYNTRHGVRGDANAPHCQSCHGESANHLANKKTAPDIVFKKGSFTASDAKAQSASCLACHQKDSKRNHWEGGPHQSGDVSCVSCHTVHNTHDKVRDRKTQTEVCFSCHKDQRVLSHKISHHPMNEGKVVCSDCHNPHGSAGPKMMKKNTINETCFQCHAEKRGPFLWEHQPVTEDCTSCHNAHGSNMSPLLKSRAPMLCKECHDGPHVSGSPSGANQGGTQGGYTGSVSATTAGRACLNCHSMVHGSNHPAGAFLFK